MESAGVGRISGFREKMQVLLGMGTRVCYRIDSSNKKDS